MLFLIFLKRCVEQDTYTVYSLIQLKQYAEFILQTVLVVTLPHLATFHLQKKGYFAFSLLIFNIQFCEKCQHWAYFKKNQKQPRKQAIKTRWVKFHLSLRAQPSAPGAGTWATITCIDHPAVHYHILVKSIFRYYPEGVTWAIYISQRLDETEGRRFRGTDPVSGSS